MYFYSLSDSFRNRKIVALIDVLKFFEQNKCKDL